MDTIHFTNRKLTRMFLRILSVFVILVMALPTTGSASAQVTLPFSGRDEFNGALAEGWDWINENPAKWSLTENPGFLRMYASTGGTGSENVLLRPVSQHDFMIKTRVLFEPDTNFQYAGLVVWQDESNFLQLGRAFCDVEGACVGNGIYFDKILGGGNVDGNFATQINNPSQVDLRLERRGDMVRAFYSIDQGISWYETGIHWIPPDFQVNKVGLVASQDFYTPTWDIPADFDFFELTEGSGFLPEGFHDYDQGDVPVGACNAGGWAADPDDRAADVNVEIVVDDQTVTTLPAAEFRQDLLDAGVCVDGNCSFSTGLWGSISSSEPHRVDAWAQDTSTGEWVLLSNSAKTLTCRTHDIYTFEPATGKIQLITHLPNTHEYNPRWSPDGKKIVHDVWGDDWSWHQVHITDIKTGVSTPLLGAENGSYPSWSPSGKWIAFDRENNLFIVPAAGGTAKLVRNDAVLAAWSPNSQQLVFHQPSDGSIRTVELKGGGETLISESGYAPAWSPDGEWIAYQKDGDIWKVKVNNHGAPVGNAIQLTSSPIFEDRPTWSNNSGTIAYHAGMTGDFDIWTVPAAGGMPTWLNGAPNYGDYDPNYSFNGKFISYSSFSPNGQAPRQWGAAFSYDVGTWTEGDHAYHLENTYSVPESGGEILPVIPFNVSSDAGTYNGTVLLRGLALRARVGNGCPAIESVITPEQNTRFHYGWQTTVEMTYAEANAHFNSMSVNAYWDDGMSAELQRHEIFPWSSVNWDDYICAATEAPREPVLYIHYEYPDVVEGDYELGHTVQVTVFDSEWNIKATATVETMEMPHWGGSPGFRVEQWDGMEGPPDIQPGDVVRAVVDGGPLTVETRIGEITAVIDPDANTITGTINAPWAGDTVNVLCMPWGAPEGAGDKETTVAPDGVSEFTCTWDPTEWDIQPGETAGVAYWSANLHWIANAASNPWMMAFPSANQVFGYGWPVGSEVNLIINGEDIGTVTVQGAPWDANDVMAFFDFGGMHDLVAGDVVTLSGSGMERTHIVQRLAVTDIDVETSTVSGTADPDASVHAWVHGFGQDVWLTAVDGMWTASFGSDEFQLQPGMCGRAEIRAEGNNSTNVDWCVPNPRFSVFHEQEAIEGWDWPLGSSIHLTIDDPATAQSPDYEQYETGTLTPWGSGQLWVWFEFPDQYDVKPGDIVTLTDGVTARTHTVRNLAITQADAETNVIAGTADAGAEVHVWPHGYNELIPTAGESGFWLADFDSIDIDLTEGMSGRTEIRDEFGNATTVDWYIPRPRMTVFPESEWFDGWDWPDDATVTISVEGKSECTVERVSQGYFFNGNFGEGCDLEIGDTVTFSDGTTTRTHVVENLDVQEVSLQDDAIYGTADVGKVVHVWIHDYGNSELVLNVVDGTWMAAFWDLEIDLVEGMCGRSEIRDDLGNATAVDWCTPDPHFTVFPEWDYIEGWGWAHDYVYLHVDDPAIPGEWDFYTQALSEPDPGDPNNTRVTFDLKDQFDLKPGDTVYFDDDAVTRDMVIKSLSVTDVNEAEDTVSGKAGPYSTVYVWPHATGEQIQITADRDGNWQVDFTDAFDLVPGECGRAEVRDQFDNGTAVDWCVRGLPRITVYPDAQWVDGAEWPDGSTVTISVQDQPACTMTMEPSGGEFFGGFPQDCLVAAGNVINFTNGTHTVEYTVRNLAITKIDKDANTVMGIADTDAVVHVWIWDMDGTDIEVTAVNDEWVADFGASGIDLDMNMGFQAEIRDENGNGTSVDYGTYTRIVASITENWFYVIDFDPLSTLNYSIYDTQGGTLLANGTFPADVNGYGGLDFEDHGQDLEPGNYLVITDGTTQKELVIEGFTFDTFDLSNGQLAGTASGGEGREVWAGIGFPNQPAWMMTVGVNEAGAWFVDFGAPVPGDYQWVAAQIYDADGDASELRPASQIVFLRPSCGSTYTVEAGSLVEIRYGSWIAIGEELALQNAEHLTVDLVLNGETLIGTQQPVVPRSEIPCGSPLDNAYGVFYVTQLGPLTPGTYVAKVTWILDEPVTDGYDANGDGEPDWYGPGEVFTHEFTINVQ